MWVTHLNMFLVCFSFLCITLTLLHECSLICIYGSFWLARTLPWTGTYDSASGTFDICLFLLLHMFHSAHCALKEHNNLQVNRKTQNITYHDIKKSWCQWQHVVAQSYCSVTCCIDCGTVLMCPVLINPARSPIIHPPGRRQTATWWGVMTVTLSAAQRVCVCVSGDTFPHSLYVTHAPRLFLFL